MQFTDGAEVMNAEGKKVGEVDRVVMDPKTREITHIVVKKGLIFTEDKVIPLDRVETATEDRVTLKAGTEAMEDLPDFRDTEYIPMEDTGPDRMDRRHAVPFTWYYGEPGLAWWDYPGFSMPPYVAKTETNIPEGTVAIEEGSRVYSRDEEDLGEVERVYVDSGDHRASHITVVKGILSKERRTVPTAWIDSVREHEIRLAVNKAFVERLPLEQAA